VKLSSEEIQKAKEGWNKGIRNKHKQRKYEAPV